MLKHSESRLPLNSLCGTATRVRQGFVLQLQAETGCEYSSGRLSQFPVYIGTDMQSDTELAPLASVKVLAAYTSTFVQITVL